MKPVIVEVSRSGAPQLFGKDHLAVVFAFDHIGGQLGRQGEAVTRVARNQRLPGSLLAPAAAVHPGGVKIGEAPRKKGVHHLFHQLDVDAALVVGIGQRKPHQSEAQFFT